MKRITIILFAILLVIIAFTGCSDAAGSPATTTPKPEGDSSVLSGTPPAAVSGTEDPEKYSPKVQPESDDRDIVDLTALSSTMVYAEVYNMMMEPENYIGKTIKMTGPCYSDYYEVTDQFYHFVIVEDATACCLQGLEFVWNGDHTYPDDYPANDTVIEVSGVFSSYEEEGETYYFIATDKVVVV